MHYHAIRKHEYASAIHIAEFCKMQIWYGAVIVYLYTLLILTGRYLHVHSQYSELLILSLYIHTTVPAGGTLVNFGCGPTVHCNISASAVFKDIICAEYTEANRRELGKWLSNDDDKFDWSVFFKYVAVLEGER